MKEKRRSERSPIRINLNISDIYAPNYSSIQNLKIPIALVNISADGIGFVTDCVLPLQHYFQVSFALVPEQPEVTALLKIIRVEVKDTDSYLYGCEFVILKDADKRLIEAYSAGACP